MDNEPAKRRGAPIFLWLLGVAMIIFGLVRRSAIISHEKSQAHISRMFNDMAGTSGGDVANLHAADWTLWLVGIGVLLLAVALIVQLVRRP